MRLRWPTLDRYPRAMAIFGIAWILAVGGFFLSQGEAPLPWKLGYGQYGLVGVWYFVGVLRGRSGEASWTRRGNRVILISFTLAAAAFVGSLFQAES